MPRIYTEIRIHHKTPEDKEKYEQAIDNALSILGYKSRVEWIDEALGEMVRKAAEKEPKSLTGIIKRLKESK